MDSEFIGLYLDLYEGQKPELDTVAAASIHFSTLIKEIAYLLDPAGEHRLEFVSGTEGSLSINTVLKAVKDTALSPTTLKAIIVAVACFLANDTRQYGVTALLDKYFKGDSSSAHLSDEDIQKIANRVQEALHDRVATEQAQKVYTELQREPAIKGVGVTKELGARPIFTVPREEFASRISAPPSEVVAVKRDRTVTELVTLVSPVLLPGKRKWRFRTDLGEFTAPVLDQKFLDSLLSGRRRVPMKSGIQILAKIKLTEEKVNDVWVIVDRAVIQVLKVPKQPLQTNLDFSALDEET